MMRPILALACSCILAAADAAWPDLPDPIGLGPRLVTIAWLQSRNISLPPEMSDLSLIEIYHAAQTGGPGLPSEILARRNHLLSTVVEKARIEIALLTKDLEATNARSWTAERALADLRESTTTAVASATSTLHGDIKTLRDHLDRANATMTVQAKTIADLQAENAAMKQHVSGGRPQSHFANGTKALPAAIKFVQGNQVGVTILIDITPPKSDTSAIFKLSNSSRYFARIIHLDAKQTAVALTIDSENAQVGWAIDSAFTIE